MQFKRIMKALSGCARLCNANTERKSNVDSHMLYYSKNPADGSLSLLKLKLFQKHVVGFAIPDERVDGNRLKNKTKRKFALLRAYQKDHNLLAL